MQALSGRRDAETKAILTRRRRPMPLVRIDLQKGKDANYRQKAGRIVYEAMVASSGIPKNDHFQIIGEHSPRGEAEFQRRRK
jgi:Tautomerase enzyme